MQVKLMLQQMEKKQVKLVGNSTGKSPFYEFFFLCGNSQSSEKQTQHHFTRWHSSSWNCSFHLRNMKTRWCAHPMVCLLSLACSYQFLSSYICMRFLTRCAQPAVCLLPLPILTSFWVQTLPEAPDKMSTADFLLCLHLFLPLFVLVHFTMLHTADSLWTRRCVEKDD